MKKSFIAFEVFCLCVLSVLYFIHMEFSTAGSIGLEEKPSAQNDEVKNGSLDPVHIQRFITVEFGK